MNKHPVDQLTLREVESMPRPDLLASLSQLTAFLSGSPSRFETQRMSDDELRQLVNRARRKFQQLGY